MPKFVKKPIIVKAVRLTRPIQIETLRGMVIGKVGDWLITGVSGEQYPCRHDIFMQTYDPIEKGE